MEFARDSFELGNIWREVHRELKLKELWMEKKVLKKGKEPSRQVLEASERISGGIIDENAKQGKCHGKNSEQRQAKG